MTSLGLILLSISASISNLLAVTEIDLVAAFEGVASLEDDAWTDLMVTSILNSVW